MAKTSLKTELTRIEALKIAQRLAETDEEKQIIVEQIMKSIERLKDIKAKAKEDEANRIESKNKAIQAQEDLDTLDSSLKKIKRQKDIATVNKKKIDLIAETPELKKENRIATLALNTKFKKRWKDYEKQCPYKK